MACVVSLGEVMMEGSTSKRGDFGGTCAFSGVDDGDQNAAIFGPSRTCDVECRRMQHGGHSCNLDMTSTAVKEQTRWQQLLPWHALFRGVYHSPASVWRVAE